MKANCVLTRGSAPPQGLEQSMCGGPRPGKGGASVKTAREEMHSFGVEGTTVEVLRLNSQNITKGISPDCVPLKPAIRIGHSQKHVGAAASGDSFQARL